MILNDLKTVIPKNCKVGITDRDNSDLPYVDTWENWINGGLKTLDVKVLQIESAGYLLITLDI